MVRYLDRRHIEPLTSRCQLVIVFSLLQLDSPSPICRDLVNKYRQYVNGIGQYRTIQEYRAEQNRTFDDITLQYDVNYMFTIFCRTNAVIWNQLKKTIRPTSSLGAFRLVWELNPPFIQLENYRVCGNDHVHALTGSILTDIWHAAVKKTYPINGCTWKKQI